MLGILRVTKTRAPRCYLLSYIKVSGVKGCQCDMETGAHDYWRSRRSVSSKQLHFSTAVKHLVDLALVLGELDLADNYAERDFRGFRLVKLRAQALKDQFRKSA